MPSNDPNVPDFEMLDQVSQIVPTGTPAPPVRYDYGYVQFATASVRPPYLNSIAAPNPKYLSQGSGSPLSAATIQYEGVSPHRVLSITDANGNKTSLSYPPVTGNRVKVEHGNSAGIITKRYFLDYTNNNLSRVGNAADATVVSYEYNDPDNAFRPSRIVDGAGRATLLDWDNRGNLLSSQTPRGARVEYGVSYDATDNYFGKVDWVRSRSATNQVKTLTEYTYYQPSGLVASVRTPKPGTVGTGQQETTYFSYNVYGDVTQVISPGNNAAASRTVTIGYGPSPKARQPRTITDELGKVTSITYTTRGMPLTVTDPSGNATSFTYNLADDRLTATLPATGNSGPFNTQVSYRYLYTGSEPDLVEVRNESGTLVRRQEVDFGSEGEPVLQTGDGDRWGATYDELYRQKTITDGNGNVTNFVYYTPTADGANAKLCQLKRIEHPLKSGNSFDQVRFTAYNIVGDLLEKYDGNNNRTNYAYSDPDGLLSSVTYAGIVGQNYSLTYDAFGRMSQVTDGTGNVVSNYDDLDGLTSAVRTYTGIPAKTVSYEYYADGSRKKIVYPGGEQEYFYNARGECAAMSSPAGTSAYTYYDNGWLRYRDLPTGHRAEHQYNALGLPTLVKNTAPGGATVSNFGSFGYNGAFDVAQMVASVPGQPSFGGATYWTYDEAGGRSVLTREQNYRGGAPYTDNYSADPAWNLTTFTNFVRTYNADNQWVASSMAYDGNGAPTTYKSNAAAYDRESRLTSYGSSWTARYRADGLRAWRQVSGARRYFLYDGGNPVVELDSAGNVAAVNVFGPEGLVSRQEGGSTLHYLFDWQGNVAQKVSGAGAVLEHCWYKPYGAESRAGTLQSDPWGYNAQSGYYLDRSTGLYLCQARYYDPALGRFLTRDPIGHAGGTNLYAYCGSNPLGRSDPSGLLLPALAPAIAGVGGGSVAIGGGAVAGVALGAAPVAAGTALGAAVGAAVGAGLNAATDGGWARFWGDALGIDTFGVECFPADARPCAAPMPMADVWDKYLSYRHILEATFPRNPKTPDECDEAYAMAITMLNRLLGNPRSGAKLDMKRTLYNRIVEAYADCRSRRGK